MIFLNSKFFSIFFRVCPGVNYELIRKNFLLMYDYYLVNRLQINFMYVIYVFDPFFTDILLTDTDSKLLLNDFCSILNGVYTTEIVLRNKKYQRILKKRRVYIEALIKMNEQIFSEIKDKNITILIFPSIREK